jgi:DNA modification methylase
MDAKRKPRQGRRDPEKDFAALAEAAIDRTPVSGWTHNFYRYPARFSPKFAAAAIALFSKPGDLVLDPYMGGGTSIVEGVVAGRRMVGNDLNSLGAFIARVKVTGLNANDAKAVQSWATHKVPRFSYWVPAEDLAEFIDPIKTFNLGLAKSRFIKKAVAAALATIADLPSWRARNFARCAVLRVGQWALDGRESHTTLGDFRDRLAVTTKEMLTALAAMAKEKTKSGGKAAILHGDAAELGNAKIFAEDKKRVALVVTSPPYPGVHVLYHRWQVDGRRETPAPYWIANCNDGQGGSFYNFGDRRESAADKYFAKSLTTLKAIRGVMKDGGYMIQMVAFNRPADHLPRYLKNMVEAGFAEVSVGNRIWRQVPGRKWHARQKGKTNSSKEVVLVHRAIKVTG